MAALCDDDDVEQEREALDAIFNIEGEAHDFVVAGDDAYAITVRSACAARFFFFLRSGSESAAIARIAAGASRAASPAAPPRVGSSNASGRCHGGASPFGGLALGALRGTSKASGSRHGATSLFGGLEKARSDEAVGGGGGDEYGEANGGAPAWARL